ncbi:MAG: UDP-N-acetylmuramate dehydrogenase [bacterium]|nr:UDP-N-acetylmuramate dehydrogenase [bacterium]
MLEHVDIKPHTTFGVGGMARYFVEVESSAELIEAINFAKKSDIRYVIIAGGSNLVFGDGLLDMLVIKMMSPKDIFNYIRLQDGNVVCDAGVTLMDFINWSIRYGLSGLEALSGIPGSVGGAIVGNAGAYGQNISGPLVEVEIFDGEDIRTLTKEECGFTYRDSIFKNKSWVVLSAKYSFTRDDPEVLKKKSKEIIETRNKKYTPGIKCPGSFFKNILIENIPEASLKHLPKDRDYFGKVVAGYLLEQVGAKGMKEGGVEIANFHGNLLMNTGEATFKDVITLAEKLKKLVLDKFGIQLEEEVRYIR